MWLSVLRSIRGFLEGFLELVSDFKEPRLNFSFTFLYKKAAKNLETIYIIYRKHYNDKIV
jgi:hypothetical protein